MRRLIINADDFGITLGVNRGIAQAHAAGMVTSATLMAAGQRVDDAVQTARGLPKLSVGCHVVLVDGTPLAAPTEIPSLVPGRNGPVAQFRTRLSSFAMAALTGKIAADQIEAEATAQIRKLQSSGISVSHLDTHKHTHMFPAVLESVLRAARACRVRALRNPFVRAGTWPPQMLRDPGLMKRFVQAQVLRAAMFSRFRKVVRSSGLATPDGSLGIIETGYLDQSLLDALIDAMPEGIWELVCHPGYCDADLAGIKTRLRQSRAQELQLLTSPGTRERLGRRGIQLISYNDFLAGATA